LQHGPDGAAARPGGWLSRRERGRVSRHAPGSALARPETAEQAPQDNRFFVLTEGLARISLIGAGRELVLGHLRPGGLYVSHTRAWVMAVEECKITSWPVRDMLELVSREPELGVQAFREIGTILQGALSLVEDLAFRPVESRLARFLLAEALRQGGPELLLDGSTESLAAGLGTSRQTLSTLLNRLIRDGTLARTGRRRLKLCDATRLERMAAVSSG